jgi:hypothetical protein
MFNKDSWERWWELFVVWRMFSREDKFEPLSVGLSVIVGVDTIGE